jgi:hypothetical protein
VFSGTKLKQRDRVTHAKCLSAKKALKEHGLAAIGAMNNSTRHCNTYLNAPLPVDGPLLRLRVYPEESEERAADVAEDEWKHPIGVAKRKRLPMSYLFNALVFVADVLCCLLFMSVWLLPFAHFNCELISPKQFHTGHAFYCVAA